AAFGILAAAFGFPLARRRVFMPKEPASLDELDARLERLEIAAETRGKDFWDKLGTLSGLVTGVLVAVIGFYATEVYDQRSRATERQDRERNVVAVELQTVERFFPHLVSQNDTE